MTQYNSPEVPFISTIYITERSIQMSVHIIQLIHIVTEEMTLPLHRTHRVHNESLQTMSISIYIQFSTNDYNQFQIK